MKPWKTLKRREICRPNRFLSVELHEVELPDGARIDDWPWVITPDFVNVIVRTTEGGFLCFRQTKYAVGGVCMAPIGGFIEKGEEPLAAAQRELLEETGYAAEDWRPLGSFVVDANRGAGTGHMFLALDARPQSQPTPDDLEEQELLTLTKEELEAALDRGEFKTLPWVTVVALALREL